MPLRVRHAKTSSVPATADASLVQPSDWNADHPITSDGPGLVGRTAAGAGPVAEVSAADGRALLGLGTAATQPISAFEPAGAVAAHVAAGDPHPQYMTPAEMALWDRTRLTDSRGASRAPNFYDTHSAQWDFQQNTDTQAGGDTWHGLLTVHPWGHYNDHHRQQQIAFTGTGGLRFRYATSETTWDAWQTVWTSGNSAQVQAGTINGQFSRWNHPAGRWDAIDPAVARTSMGVDSYVASRGQNLITNGTGLLRNNTNFPGFTFDGTDAFFSTGSFRDSTFASARITEERLPIDPTQTYRLSLFAKANPATGGRNFVGIAMYDADGLLMTASDYMFSSPATTLAVDLLPGATTITLASTTGWTGSVNSFGRGIIVWNYVNSLGFAYPPQTYSRNWFHDLWASDASVNTSTGVITLSVPWAGVAIPAGTPLSRSNSGGTFKYITTATNIPYTNQWVAHTGTIGGVDTTGTNINNMFPPGVASVRLVFLNNRDIAGSTAWYSNIQFGVDLQEAFDGTANNQLGRWNQTARRWEVLTPAMLPDALDDAAAAVAGVAVGTVYRTGTTIKMRIA